MATKPNMLERLPVDAESKVDPHEADVERLLALLDPVVINAPHDRKDWKKLGHEAVVWLVSTAAKTVWLNHLALAGIIHADGGTAHPAPPLARTLFFLRWAIPEHYPDLASLNVEAALVTYYGDPPRSRGTQAMTAISSFQLYTTRYLETLPLERRKALSHYLLPKLIRTRRLTKLRILADGQTQSARKEQAFAVVRELPALVALGRQRYKWLAELDQRVQQTVELIQKEQATFPAMIKLAGLSGQDREIVFRVWDKRSWVAAHTTSFAKRYVSLTAGQHTPAATQTVFLQLVGDLPEVSWFLRAIGHGVPPWGTLSPEARHYMQKWQLRNLTSRHGGLLNSSRWMGVLLGRARLTAAGTPEDSRVVFCVEPMLAAAAVGLFVLISLVQTGMRIGELLQVTLDKDCIETGCFPQFNDADGAWKEGSKQIYWQLYPKGRDKRERYLVTPQMLEAMLIMLDLHKRLYGPDRIRPIPGGAQFSHSRQYTGKHKFVLQWRGHHIRAQAVQQCLAFLLLEHPCRDQEGKPTWITPHILRHGVASWLRNQGVPLEDIMALLKQVNIAVTDYYSKPSLQNLYQKIGPALTTLTDLAGIDPTTIRNAWDVQNLRHEALKCYGILRHTPGGSCSVFTPCEVQFKCAGCPYYVPDPARREEVQEKIVSCSKAIQLFMEMGDYLQADNQKSYLREWERVEKEMEALAMAELAAPSAEKVLKDVGIAALGKELLQSLKQAPKRLPGGHPKHA